MKYQHIRNGFIIDEQKKNLSMKDDKIDNLQNDIKLVLSENRSQSNKLDKLMLTNNNILNHNNFQTNLIIKMHTKIDDMFNFIKSYARTTISTWTGAAVFKTQFENLQKSTKNENEALYKLKVMFTIGLYGIWFLLFLTDIYKYL
jgi:hypothetical protein